MHRIRMLNSSSSPYFLHPYYPSCCAAGIGFILHAVRFSGVITIPYARKAISLGERALCIPAGEETEREKDSTASIAQKVLRDSSSNKTSALPAEEMTQTSPTVETCPQVIIPPTPILRDPKPSELKYPVGKKPSPEECVAVGVPNEGNTCFAASVVHWLFSHKEALIEKKVVLEEREKIEQGKDLVIVKEDLELCERFIHFIEVYQRTASAILEDPNYLPKYVVFPSLLVISLFQLPQLVREWNCFQASKKQGQQSSIPQQDAGEMIRFLYDFIYSHSTSQATQQATYCLDIDEGERVYDEDAGILDVSSGYRPNPVPFLGVLSVCLPVNSVIVETKNPVIANGKTYLFPIKQLQHFPKNERALDLSQLIHSFFVEGRVEPFRNQRVLKAGEEFAIKKEGVDVLYAVHRLSQAPEQLTVEMKRFQFNKDTLKTDKIECPISGLKEVMVIPGDYFEDHREATYYFHSAIIHIGDSPQSGHYISIAKRFDSKTGERYFVEVNDEIVTQITPQEALEKASKSYILHFEKAKS